MPDISTESSDLRRPNRRPIKEVAGEVTKKIIGLNDQALPPPTFTSPKIGGAIDFLTEDLDIEQTKENREDTRDIREIGGINAAMFTTSESSVHASEPEHPFAAPPGWRRYWGVLKWENLNIPDVIISPFCKHCYDDGFASSCTRIRHETSCQTYHMAPCRYIISYKPHPAEDISILDIPEYSMRCIARDRLATIGTPLEIPTADTERSVYIRRPPKPARAEEATPRHRPKKPEPRPTYSQVRGAYEDLSEGIHRDTMMGQIRVEDDRPQSAPTWVIDVNEHTRFPSGYSLPLPPLQNALIPSDSYQRGDTRSLEGLTMEQVLSGNYPGIYPPISRARTRRAIRDRVMAAHLRENRSEEGETRVAANSDESSEEDS